ncbi:uncharacterized protein LACBIDRAFT_313964 [Laccaria bicolor S238N-H82]|uniref:Predicted protein n=1 Tax=Laccaria bicolor (strain S238N-H82 / ATCC MYA-4686) TaxID=486041 RepID=B0D192_LACBS|nr:uncharacterized protein LACBIDRAFT_313964 [Laccaria bicolor S238N-H82]EDR11593.1 predicted protein [Laccaria bicolor S238N-H82]|eukprot:XP_001877490.1 predicted protein [Laccaria bicolor S238N-H82]
MTTNRVWRTLSAFNSSIRRWAPLPLKNTQRQVRQVPKPLTITSWNVDALSSRPVARARHILSHILEGQRSSDIIFLQEVNLDVRASILNDPRVRSAFLTTDAEDQTAFAGVPFATMTLLSSARFASSLDSQEEGETEGGEKLELGRVFRVILPSKYGRDGLCVEIVLPTATDRVLRLINVHLDSLWDTLPYRAQQLEMLADVLHEPGCSGGIIAGDFNAVTAEDQELLEKNGLVDAWLALHGWGNLDAATWGVGVGRRDGRGPRRLDKVAMVGLEACKMEVLRPGVIELPIPKGESINSPWSDHCGLRCTFTI